MNGIAFISLGHGLSDPVARHEYFGDKIVHDLEKLPGWDEGCVSLRGYKFIRGTPSGDDPKGKIVGLAPRKLH